MRKVIITIATTPAMLRDVARMLEEGGKVTVNWYHTQYIFEHEKIAEQAIHVWDCINCRNTNTHNGEVCAFCNQKGRSTNDDNRTPVFEVGISQAKLHELERELNQKGIRIIRDEESLSNGPHLKGFIARFPNGADVPIPTLSYAGAVAFAICLK